MALPPGVVAKTVTLGIGTFFDGTVVSGRATVSAPVNVVHTTTNRPLYSSDMTKSFTDGVATFDLCPTDAEGLNRKDWSYRLKVEISGANVQPEVLYFLLPTTGPDTVDLDSLVTVPSSAGVPISVPVVTSVNGQVGDVTIGGGTGGGGADMLLPASNGTDDTAALNAVLATGRGRRVRGLPGETYRLTGPLLLPPLPAGTGGMTLDMSGCRIKGVGSGAFNMLRNAGFYAQRSTTDAVTVADSPTLSSATAGFSAADVGSYVKIPGANVGGDLLCARIVSVSNGTTATLDTPARTALTGATLEVHAVDYDLTLIGGTWDHLPDNRPWVYDVRDHSIVLRAVERFVVRDMTHTSKGGKYAIHVAGAAYGRITGHFYDGYASDGVHIHGPALAIDVRDLAGSTNDDMFVITGQESSFYDPNNYNDWIGDIRQVTGENIHKTGGLARIAYVSPGRSGSLYDIRIRNVSGWAVDAGVMVEGDQNRGGGIIEDLIVEDVNTSSTTGTSQVLFKSAPCGRVVLSNIWREATSNDLIEVTASNIASLLVSGVRIVGTSRVLKSDNSTFGDATFNDVRLKQTANVYSIHMFGTTSIETLALSNWTMDAVGDSSVVALDSISAHVGLLRITGLRYTNPDFSGSLVRSYAPSTLVNFHLTDVLSAGAYWLADLETITTVRLTGVRAAPGHGIHVKPIAAVQLEAVSTDIQNPFDVVEGTLRVLSPTYRGDASTVNNRMRGDQIFNTNEGLSCGTGTVMWSGTAWKNLIDGATYTP